MHIPTVTAVITLFRNIYDNLFPAAVRLAEIFSNKIERERFLKLKIERERKDAIPHDALYVQSS